MKGLDHTNWVTATDELREILGPVSERVKTKIRTELTEMDRLWLAASPFCLVATSDANGACDVSPKGDPPGFTHVLDEQTLVIPERPGNRRADGFHNILQNGQVGLIYFVPGRGDTLRINGGACIAREGPFFDDLIVNGRRPTLALVVSIDEVFFHCSKAFLRSDLWRPESWSPEDIPSLPVSQKRSKTPERQWWTWKPIMENSTETGSMRPPVETPIRIGPIQMNQGDACWSSKGSILTLDPQIIWSLKVPGGAGGAVKRALSGEGIGLTYIETESDGKEVILSSNRPGKIIDWNLENGPVITTRGSFVAAFGPRVDINVTIAKRTGAAFFGGAGLFLQRISGQGVALIHGAGDFMDRYLEDGETILVSTGNLAAFDSNINYTIQAVGDLGRTLFSGEGLFMTKLTGPGRVLLQSLKQASAGDKS